MFKAYETASNTCIPGVAILKPANHFFLQACHNMKGLGQSWTWPPFGKQINTAITILQHRQKQSKLEIYQTMSDVKYQFAGLQLEMIISAGAKTARKIV